MKRITISDQWKGIPARILFDLKQERIHQIGLWGGAVHDDNHSMRDWGTFIMAYLGKAMSSETDYARNRHLVRGYFLQAAALAIAAIEAIDRRDG